MHTHITTQPAKPIRLRLFLILLLLALPITALGQQTAERKVLILLQQLDDKDKVTSNNASEQLEQIGSAAIPHLIKALKYRDSRIRGNAARRLGYLGPGAREAVPALVEALQDRDESVIYEAADALERMELEADIAIPIFINLLKADDPLLR